MCRRGFIRYLYDQMSAYINGNESTIFSFDKETSKFQCDPSISFHMLTTHSPCGDASIVPHDVGSSEVPAKKLRLDTCNPTDDCSIGHTLVSSQHFTGAKIICNNNDAVQDRMIQSVGVARTKPGRGDPTLSMSCSDKLAKWNVLGIQGALLHRLLDKSIYLDSIILCNGNYANVAALKRALTSRFDGRLFTIFPNFQRKMPQIAVCDDIKIDFQKNDRLEPCPSSIVWCKAHKKAHEVSVAGRRQGITKKKLITRTARLLISKIEMFRIYIELMEELLEKNLIGSSPTNLRQMSYQDVKCLSTDYQKQWNEIKHNMFSDWSEKPSQYKAFCID